MYFFVVISSFVRGKRYASYRCNFCLFAKIRGPIALIIQGAAVAVIGLVVVIANLGGNTASMQVDKGHIDSVYEHTTGGVYDATWITLTNNELYIFDKSSLNPNWDNQAFKGEKIDIYYKDETPRQVAALVAHTLHQTEHPLPEPFMAASVWGAGT